VHGVMALAALPTLAAVWTAVAVVLLLPCLVLLAEVLLAVTAGRTQDRLEGVRPSVAVIVPAHDEAPIIAQTLRSITPQLGVHDRVIVVADNCADATAAVARAAGAEAVERTDPVRRGKGYALDFAVRYLESIAPDVVIVVDADCQIAPDAIDRLARQCALTGRPVQAQYQLSAPQGAGLAVRLKQFACALKNEARPLGLSRLGLPCQLTGSGMAFPWCVIRAARLASGQIVEDLQLGIELTRSGTPPLFCPTARVTSELPTASAAIQSQRLRWEHGHLAAIVREGPRLLLGSLARGNLPGVALATDLMVPPLALLLLLIGAHWLVGLTLYAAGGALPPLLLATLAALLLALSVLLAWLRYGREFIPFSALALAPLYALGKVPLYAKFLHARQKAWVRSRRNHEAR
jgi:cellulose synthase/poly-beta-1,6-N-acetylglucosamine synthase-like glycosyltransferase